MSVIVDRQTLVEQFNAYIKRNFAADQSETFLQLAHDRIFRDLRPRETMLEVQITPTSVLIDLPTDFVDIRQLSYQKNSRRVTLRSVGRHELGLFSSLTGDPLVYSIIGNQAEIAPTGFDREFTLWYWQLLPQLVADTDTNIILQKMPELYLYGMLIEGNVFIQDQEQRAASIEVYLSEVGNQNKVADSSRFGEAPVIGSA